MVLKNKIKYIFILPLLLLTFMLSSCKGFEFVKNIKILTDSDGVIGINGFDCSLYEIEVNYTTGRQEIIPLTMDLINEYDRLFFYKEGEHTIRVEYMKKQTSFKINVLMNSFSDDINFFVANSEIIDDVITLNFDGTAHKVELLGDIPDGSKIYFKQGDEFTNAALYDIEATLVCEGYYVKTLKTNLRINRADYDMSEISFEENKEFIFDSLDKTFKLQGDIPKSLDVNYQITGKTNGGIDVDVKGCTIRNAGTYHIVATFENKDPNYNKPSAIEGDFKILPKEYDLSNIGFEDLTITYDGKAHSIPLKTPTGYQFPEYIFYITTYDDKFVDNVTDVGVYNVETSFYSLNDNYTVKKSLNAKLTIEPEIIKIKDVIFDGASYTFTEGVERKLVCNADKDNYDGEVLTLPNYVSFKGYLNKQTQELVDEVKETNAGKYTYYAVFECSDVNHKIEGDGMYEAVLEIKPQTYIINNVLFEDKTYKYQEGIEYSLTYDMVEDNVLPSYVEAVYSDNNLQEEVGEYKIILTFVSNNPNYEILSINYIATLTIVDSD